MTTRDILFKITKQIEMGITSEVQVVYLLAGCRKLIERDAVMLPNLKFHWDWALHARMSYAGAKSILKQFDEAHDLLRNNIKLQDLPGELRHEIDRISKMRSFKEELLQFLVAYDLPALTKHRHDGWSYFLHLYARVIEDIPLVVSVPNGPDSPKHISHVTVHFEAGQETMKFGEAEEAVFKVTWRTHGKDGLTGDIDVINSFLLINEERNKPKGRSD